MSNVLEHLDVDLSRPLCPAASMSWTSTPSFISTASFATTTTNAHVGSSWDMYGTKRPTPGLLGWLT